MWAQDAAAMYGYAGASAAAAALTPFAAPTGHVSISSLEIASLPLLGVRIATIPATYITAALGGKNVENMLERLSNAPATRLSATPVVATPVTATMGRAATVGKLSVPQDWAATTPAIEKVDLASRRISCPESQRIGTLPATIGQWRSPRRLYPTRTAAAGEARCSNARSTQPR
ncbi:PE/PPE C-terminal domain-containing protein [Mycobacterium angelicum]|nr:PE/PPE C-terminal domain-containing protein [Mycobacterium angelicum]